jgi:LuxR family maltose regulon positive regulatory protein
LNQGRKNDDLLALQESFSMLARLEEETANRHLTDNWIKILALKAMAYQAAGDTRQAIDALGHALILGECEWYIRTFIDEGAEMRRLIGQVYGSVVSDDYLSRLKSAFHISPGHANVERLPLLDPLSDRELQVLRYLKTHLTTTEIADELIISVHTVRSHIKTIYGKLQVNSRTQAVERAKALGID